MARYLITIADDQGTVIDFTHVTTPAAEAGVKDGHEALIEAASELRDGIGWSDDEES
jgi:hypothetical protein